MCKRDISLGEAKAFFEEGKTPLITDFISKRGRPFKAHLVLNKEGRRFVEWEFPPREPKKKAAKKAAKKASAKKKSASKKTASADSES